MKKIWNKLFVCTLGLLTLFSIGNFNCTVLAETGLDSTNKVEVYGDVNGNGRIDTGDLTIMRGIIYEGEYNKPENVKDDITEEDVRHRLDLDGDGEITEYDLGLMQSYLYEEKTSFPIQLMLKEITIKSLPEKHNYKIGEELNLDGMILKVIQNNGEYRELEVSKLEKEETEESDRIVLKCPKFDMGRLILTDAILEITGDTEKIGINKITVEYSEKYLLKGNKTMEDRMLKSIKREVTFEIIVENISDSDESTTPVPDPEQPNKTEEIELSRNDIKVTPARKTISRKKSFNIKVALARKVIENRKVELEDIWENNISSIKFRSSRSSIASVSNQGKVIGQKKGKAIITTTIVLTDSNSYNYKTVVYVR